MLGIGLKLLSVAMFLLMMTLLKAAPGVPVGEMVFFRSFFAVLPIVAFIAWRGELATGWRTKHPGGHFLRAIIGVISQVLVFYALTQLPLADATVLNYTTPLLTVIAGAVILHERVRLYRWSAVVVGFVGVGIIIWPRLTFLTGGAVVGSTNPGLGAIAAIAGCAFSTLAFLQIRSLLKTERSSTIVFWFSLTSSIIALVTLPFGWIVPSPAEALMLVSAGVFGGIAQVLMTESFRHAEMSVIAPFEYASLLFSIAVGFVVFGDIPTMQMLVGGFILIGAGIFIIFREHILGVSQTEARKVVPPQG